MKFNIENKETLKFAIFPEETKNALLSIKPEPIFVPEEAVREIETILGLPNINSIDDLRAIRNGCVELLYDDNLPYDMLTVGSMVTAVIDSHIFRKGGEV